MATDLVFLIGYRGTGKSTLAGLLAQRLGWQALDADQVLQERAGRSIKQIFAEDGEAAFRDLEAGLLAEFCAGKQHVIACGGGVVLRAENRKLLTSSGVCIWLQADPQTLWQRMQADPRSLPQRPDLAQGGLAEIEQLLQVRTPLYAECASLALTTVGRAPDDLVDEMAAFLQKRGHACF